MIVNWAGWGVGTRSRSCARGSGGVLVRVGRLGGPSGAGAGSRRPVADGRLKRVVTTLHACHGGHHPRVCAGPLLGCGCSVTRVGRKRVRWLMRELSLQLRQTVEGHHHIRGVSRCRPKRTLAEGEVTAPGSRDRRWCAAITPCCAYPVRGERLPGYHDRPCTVGHTWGGRSLITCAPGWLPTPGRWRSRITNQHRAGSSAPTAAASTEPAWFLPGQQGHPVARPDGVMCRRCRVRNSSTHPTRKRGGLVRTGPWQNPTGSGPGISGLVHRRQHAAEALHDRLRDTIGETPRTYTTRRNHAATKRSTTAYTKPGELHCQPDVKALVSGNAYQGFIVSGTSRCARKLRADLVSSQGVVSTSRMSIRCVRRANRTSWTRSRAWVLASRLPIWVLTVGMDSQSWSRNQCQHLRLPVGKRPQGLAFCRRWGGFDTFWLRQPPDAVEELASRTG